jgi:hypothetical protein
LLSSSQIPFPLSLSANPLSPLTLRPAHTHATGLVGSGAKLVRKSFVPIIAGAGWTGSPVRPPELEQIDAVEGPDVTHVRCRPVK